MADFNRHQISQFCVAVFLILTVVLFVFFSKNYHDSEELWERLVALSDAPGSSMEIFDRVSIDKQIKYLTTYTIPLLEFEKQPFNKNQYKLKQKELRDTLEKSYTSSEELVDKIQRNRKKYNTYLKNYALSLIPLGVISMFNAATPE